jgi:hypothetical protein
MEDKIPVPIEKEITPIIMRSTQITLSPEFFGVISPYPTVTMVVTVK